MGVMKTMLEHLRETADLTQRNLASRAGVTQETVSQLESGKSNRPRLETLTKLRDALELDDMRAEDLLGLSPLHADEELAPAATRLISLLKVLPRHDYRATASTDPFWDELCSHLGYRDYYPASKISGHVQGASSKSTTRWAPDLAQYTLMFFDPDDDQLLQILADRAHIGPGVPVARRWCRDVTDAAWILHRAVMTSYPKQIGQLYMEAGDTDNPDRILELCGSVYAEVRARALNHASIEQQIHALRHDPAADVVYDVAAESTNQHVQETAATIQRAWPGLARNTHLRPTVADRLVTSVLTDFDAANDDHTNALLTLADRPDLPRPLLERISETIDTPDRADDAPGVLLSIVFNVRDSLRQLDQDDQHDEEAEQAAQAQRARLHIVDSTDDRPSWWRRFLS